MRDVYDEQNPAAQFDYATRVMIDAYGRVDASEVYRLIRHTPLVAGIPVIPAKDLFADFSPVVSDYDLESYVTMRLIEQSIESASAADSPPVFVTKAFPAGPEGNSQVDVVLAVFGDLSKSPTSQSVSVLAVKDAAGGIEGILAIRDGDPEDPRWLLSTQRHTRQEQRDSKELNSLYSVISLAFEEASKTS